MQQALLLGPSEDDSLGSSIIQQALRKEKESIQQLPAIPRTIGGRSQIFILMGKGPGDV